MIWRHGNNGRIEYGANKDLPVKDECDLEIHTGLLFHHYCSGDFFRLLSLCSDYKYRNIAGPNGNGAEYRSDKSQCITKCKDH
jgi:hypothetical protein